MADNKYLLRYLPLFYEDLSETIEYIADELNNPGAASSLLDEVENAILERQSYAESFEVYHSKKTRKNPYYRIYVGNYIIFYVVLEEQGSKIMEVRRFLYGGRDIPRHI